MTKRQLALLKLAREDIKAGRNWTERALSAHAGGAQMSFYEMTWLGKVLDDITVSAVDVVLEARGIIERDAPLGWVRQQ